MKQYSYEFEQTIAEIEAVLDGRDFSIIPVKPAVAAWFAWSAMAAAGEWK